MTTANRLRALDGIRGIAALWVVLAHLWHFYYSVHSGFLGWATNWLAYPHFAVDVFIVLSGFCLVLPTLSTEALRGTVGQFYRRRATRILPPLYVSLALSFLLLFLTARYGHRHDPISNSVIAANALLVQDWLPRFNVVNPVMWSVALELKIYLLFPLILLTRRRVGWVVTAVLAAAAGYGTIMLLRLAPGMDLMTLSAACPWYLFLFVMGCSAGYYAHQPSPERFARIAWALAGVSLAATLVMVYMNPVTAESDAVAMSAWPVEDALVGLASAAVLFLVTTDSASVLRRLFGGPFLVAIGTASYSLYLMHLPLLYVARIVINRLNFIPANDPSRLAAVAILGLPLVAAGTLALFWIVERPFLQHRPAERPRELALDAALSPAP